MKKIDLNGFNKTEMVARLFSLQRNFEVVRDEVLETNEKMKDYCQKLVEDNFIYPDGKLLYCAMHLNLFLLGSKKNAFDKAIL